MKNTLIDDIVSRIKDEIPRKYITMFKEAASDVLNGYIISERENTNHPYEDQYPQAFYDYMNAIRINGLSEGTIDLYEMRITMFLNSCHKELCDLRTADMREYISKYLQEHDVCNATMNNIIVILKSFFGWIFNEGFININPMHNIKVMKCEYKLQPVLDGEQLEMVRDECKYIRDRALVDFMYSTGCRISEVCALNRSSVDFDHKKIEVLGKGNKWRTVYLNSRCSVSLRMYLNSRTDDNESLFVGIRYPHKRITKDGVEAMLRRIGERLKLDKPLTPHVFRRTMATHCIKRGMTIVEVQHLLGHSNINTTMCYVQIDDTDLMHQYLSRTA